MISAVPCSFYLHDTDSSAIMHLQTRMLSAVVYQSPILQGYYTVMALEQILESKEKNPIPNMEIMHTLVLAENSDLIQKQNALRLIM